MKALVYAHLRPGARPSCFYVGKGCRNRARSTQGRNARWRAVVAECGGFDVKIVGHFDSHDEALAHEEEIIALLREMGAELANIHAGGSRGAAGMKFSEEHRRKIGEGQRGRRLSEEQRRRIGDVHRGKTISEAQKAIAAATCRARNSTPEQRAKVAAALTGRPRSAESKAKMSESQRLRYLERGAPEQSEETRAKRAATMRAWHAKRKAAAAGP